MDKSIYDTDYSKLTYGRGYVYSLQYHIVWCTKYRRDVLQDGVDVKLKAYLNKLAAEHQFTILAMEVMPDHVHLLVDCKPQFFPSDMINFFSVRKPLTTLVVRG